jgi:predicted DCC family thiol-disulfide oxidoreductase YuxK
MLVYDGDCGFCVRCARWLEAHAHDLDVVPWQTLDLQSVGLTEEQVRTAAYWVDSDAVDDAEGAIARALLACGRGYGVLGRPLLLPGVRRVAGVGYRFVARHRARLGSRDA